MDLDMLSDNGLSLGGMDSYIDDYVEGNHGDLLDASSPKGNEEPTCGLCNENYNDPRVLSCLHTFCRMCLENLMVDGTGDNLKINKIVECPNCKQETKVGDKGVALNSISCVFLTSDCEKDGGGDGADDNSASLCKFCEGRDTSWSRCADCKTFLCASCVQTHAYVCTLAEPRVREAVHALCNAHASRATLFCFTCQILICTTCSLMDHSTSEHHCERLGDAEQTIRSEIGSLIAESKNKAHLYEGTSSDLENSLSELQTQQDNAKDLINETYQSYKAILEQQRDKQLEELKKVHLLRELKIMESFHDVEQTMEKLEDAWTFAVKLLARGSVTEILSLKGAVVLQLLHLINNAPKTEVIAAIEFETDIEAFRAAVERSFGCFRRDGLGTKETSQVAEPPVGIVNSATNSSSPVSLPTSMQSSFDGDLGVGYAMPRAAARTTPPPPVSPPALQNLTALQEYNIQQLAHLAVKEDVIVPTATSAPSPTPSFTLADLFSGDAGSASNALCNLQALAALSEVRQGAAGGAVNGDGRRYLEGGHVNGDVRRYHTPSPSPPPSLVQPTLSSLINDLANGMNGMNGGQPHGSNVILGRGGGVCETLEINTMPGGGGPYLAMNLSSLSGGSPSPNSDNDVMLGDSLLNLSNGTNAASYQFRGSAAGKLNSMQIRCKYGQLGPSKGQFNSPHGFCLGSEEDIIVADTNNHRIQVFDKMGTYKFHFGTAGKEEGQLWYPRKVAVMRNSGKFVVCDRGNERSRMQIFTKNGHFVKKIAIRYVDIVAGLAVTNQGHIVAVDSVSPTVFVISEAGDLIRWFDCSDFMREPSDIAINGSEFFVCDFKGHCVVVFNENGTFVRRIGAENITNFPNGIDISDAGDVLVGDSHGNRFHVAVFTREGQLLSEFECPYVKVSRCCGLKITSEGYVVTLAKNNHHVLVLNTLYIL